MAAYESNVGETITLTDALSALDEFLLDSVTIGETIALESGHNLSDTVGIDDVLVKLYANLTAYLEDYIISVDTIGNEWSHIGDFTEDSQTDHTWTEI